MVSAVLMTVSLLQCICWCETHNSSRKRPGKTVLCIYFHFHTLNLTDIRIRGESCQKYRNLRVFWGWNWKFQESYWCKTFDKIPVWAWAYYNLETLGEGVSLTTRNTREADTGSTYQRGWDWFGCVINPLHWSFLRVSFQISRCVSLTSSASLSLSLSSTIVWPFNPLLCPLLWPLACPLAWIWYFSRCLKRCWNMRKISPNTRICWRIDGKNQTKWSAKQQILFWNKTFSSANCIPNLL